MNELERVIEQLKYADINQDDWLYDIINGCADRYIQGYMTAIQSQYNGHFCEDEPEYRETLIERLEGITNQIP